MVAVETIAVFLSRSDIGCVLDSDTVLKKIPNSRRRLFISFFFREKEKNERKDKRVLEILQGKDARILQLEEVTSCTWWS